MLFKQVKFSSNFPNHDLKVFPVDLTIGGELESSGGLLQLF